MKSVKRKKDEFERDMSPCDLLRYPRWGQVKRRWKAVWHNGLLCRPLLQLQPDSWLLSRLSPNTRVQTTATTTTNNNNNNNNLETETDSGLDSLEESDKNISAEKREKLVGVDEMQVETGSYSQSLFCVSFISEESVKIQSSNKIQFFKWKNSNCTHPIGWILDYLMSWI